jgi:chemotaxis-related protein WspD
MSSPTLPTDPLYRQPGVVEQSVAAARPDVVTCWSEVGVYGSGSCAELNRHVHCHHCPVFSAAGLRLLERPLSAEYRAERTRQYGLQKLAARESVSSSVIVFRIGEEWLALPTQVFQEVLERRSVHSLPHRRTGCVAGLANVRGELLVCISLRHALGHENVPSLQDLRSGYQRLLIVQHEGTRVALLVDEVHGPHRFRADMSNLVPFGQAPSSLYSLQRVLSWESRLVGLLDADLLFKQLTGNLA